MARIASPKLAMDPGRALVVEDSLLAAMAHENTEDAVADFRGAVYRAPNDGFPHLAIILRADDEVLLCRPVTSVEEGERVIDLISRGLAEVARRSEGDDG